MENEELDFEFVVNEDFRGLKAGTEYSFGKLTFVLDENGNGKSSLLKGIVAASNELPRPKGDWVSCFLE